MSRPGQGGYWSRIPDEILELVRTGYAFFNRAERDACGARVPASLDYWHPEGVYVNSADDPDPAVHSAIEAVRRQVGRWVDAYPDPRVAPLEVLTSGDVAFVRVQSSGHGAGSGVPIDIELAHVVTYEDARSTTSRSIRAAPPA